MNQRLITFHQKLTEKKGEAQRVSRLLKNSKKEILHLKSEITYTDTARIIIQKVAKETQQQLQYYISEIVTLALQSIFPNPYKFDLQFEEKRGKTECKMYFIRDGKEVNPLYGSGGGPLDVAATNLQFTIWSLKKTRPVIGLDEPFKYLSVNYRKRAGEVLKEIGKKLGLQIILITHSEKLASKADKIFQFDIIKGETKWK